MMASAFCTHTDTEVHHSPTEKMSQPLIEHQECLGYAIEVMTW